MKLTSLSVVFILIISPFLFITAQQSEMVQEDGKLRCFYDSVIDNAVWDAAFVLSQNVESLSYSKSMDISKARDLAVIAFFDSLHYAFNAKGNSLRMARIEACVPVLLLLENEGFSLYALKAYKAQNGQTEIHHIWFPVKHYVGESRLNGFTVRYTLEDKVFIFDHLNQTFLEGDYKEFMDRIPLYNDRQGFEDLRLAAVKNSVEHELEAYLDQYNQWAFGRSLSVKFDFPRIDDSGWKRALTDEGLIVFAQGFPVLKSKSYQHYALGGARILRKPSLIGYTYHNLLLYCRNDCQYYQTNIMNDPAFNASGTIYFSNAYEASKKGHYPCPYCRP